MSSARMQIVGFTTEPQQRVAQSGKSYVDISVAHTPRRMNRQTNEWEDVTDQHGQKVTVWARARFFEDEGDLMMYHVPKGTLVVVEGEPRVSAYLDGDQPRASLELYRPTLSIVPRKQQTGGGGWGNQPSSPSDGFASDDPWGNPSAF